MDDHLENVSQYDEDERIKSIFQAFLPFFQWSADLVSDNSKFYNVIALIVMLFTACTFCFVGILSLSEHNVYIMWTCLPIGIASYFLSKAFWLSITPALIPPSFSRLQLKTVSNNWEGLEHQVDSAKTRCLEMVYQANSLLSGRDSYINAIADKCADLLVKSGKFSEKTEALAFVLGNRDARTFHGKIPPSYLKDMTCDFYRWLNSQLILVDESNWELIEKRFKKVNQAIQNIKIGFVSVCVSVVIYVGLLVYVNAVGA